MKSNEARELMVERVLVAHKRWQRFEDMPEAKGDYSVSVSEALLDIDIDPAQASQLYANALYAAAFRGEPIGRDGMTIAVRKVVEKPI